MNIYAYHPNNSTKRLVHIDDWVVEYGPNSDGRCRICDTAVFVKGDKSQKQTHFAHYKDSGCPAVVENHKPYDCFKNFPRDAALAESEKEWAFQNIDCIYEKIRKFVKALTWSELHDLLEIARREDIWSLKDMPHDYIPYVLLTCTNKFEENKKYGRAKSCFFVLEPSPDSGEFWNSKGLQKQYIWEITIPSKDVIHHQIKLETPEPWYMKRVNELLS
jgi:hypothetical protein